MLAIRKTLKSILTKATRVAYPVDETAKIEPNIMRCDYISTVARDVYDKYKKVDVCFGLFNPREIADGIFVNVERSEIIDKVKIGGMGELEIWLNNNYLVKSMNNVLKQKKIRILNEEKRGDHMILITGPKLNQEFDLFHIRELFVADAIKNCDDSLGNSTKSRIIIYDNLRSSNYETEVNTQDPNKFDLSGLSEFVRSQLKDEFDFVCDI